MDIPEHLKEYINKEAKKIEEIDLEYDGTSQNNDSSKTEDKISKIIHTTCAICAAAALQPFPVMDIIILTPIQGAMGYKIAQAYGLNIKKESAGEILKQLIGLFGLGFAAQQTAIVFYKVFMPFVNAFVTIPTVYALTYGIGKAMEEYFRQKSLGQPINEDRIKAAYNKGRKVGKKEAKKEDIKSKWEK